MKYSEITRESKSALLKSSLFCTAMGFILSCGNLWESMSPFSVAFTASLPPVYSLLSAIGAILGSLIFKTDASVFRLTITVSTLILKTVFYFLFKKTNYLFCTLSCALPSLIFYTAEILGGTDYYAEIILFFSEIIISVAICYFFCKCREFISGNEKHLSDAYFISFTVALSSVICSLNRFAINDIPIGTLAAITVTLCCIRISRNTSLYLSVAFFVVLSLNDPSEFSYYAAIVPGVMLAVPFYESGKYMTATVFLTVSSTLCILFGGTGQSLFGLILTLLISSVLFVIIPEKFLRQFSPYFAFQYNDRSIKSAFSKKLINAAESVDTLADALDRLVKLPKDRNHISSTDIIENVCDKVCRKCRYCGVCMSEKYNDIADVLGKAIADYASGKDYTPPHYFVNICYQPKSILSETKEEYERKAESLKNECKISAVKNSISDTYRSLSYMLTEMSGELSSIDFTDKNSEESLRIVLTSLKIPFTGLSVIVKNYGRRFFEFSTSKELPDTLLSAITESLSERCLETFSPICKKITATGFIYSFTESENYAVIQKTVLLHKNDENISGDSCITFTDSDGYFYSVVCDGEGTGEYAAAQSMVATSAIRELTVGGIPLKSVIRTTGSMLISKDDREFSCTADIVKIDKYTGNATFLKAGGTFSLLRHDGKIHKIKGKSIPIGIVGETGIWEYQQKLSPGDIVIMMTDGVIDFSEDWLSGILNSKKNDSAEKIAEKVEFAVKENGITFSDDATLSVIEIKSI